MTERIVTPVATVLEANLVETEKFEEVDTGKYSITLLLKSKDIEPVQEAISKVMPKKKGASSPLLITPEGDYRLKAKSKFQIQAVNASKQPIPLETVRVGAEVRIQTGFAAYGVGGSGVTAYLGNVQLLRETPLSPPDLGFDDLEDEDLPF